MPQQSIDMVHLKHQIYTESVVGGDGLPLSDGVPVAELIYSPVPSPASPQHRSCLHSRVTDTAVQRFVHL